MEFLRRVNRPEYLFSPGAVMRRLRRGGGRREGITTVDARLPWAQEISVFPDDIGRTIIETGVFDLCVTETIHRLVEPGDIAVDVGANVGYLTNLMATRAGPAGRVLAFEPHPQVFGVLEGNAAHLDDEPKVADVEARRLALSDHAGTGLLESDGEADGHMGLASLRGREMGADENTFEVELARLDDVFPGEKLQLLKLDVEGHEHAILRGAERLLGERRVRDVVFEEHATYPAPSMTLLEDFGMTLFTLRHSPLGLRVRPIREGPAPAGWPGPNYLATFDPDRALILLRPRGWQSLGGLARLGRRGS